VNGEAANGRAAHPDAPAPACLSSYVPDPRRYDELLAGDGSVRPHWRPLIERLAADDAGDTARRSLELTRRLIIENGVSYNVYADPQGADRPWTLDPLPLVLTAEEWRAIETGVVQRARLLNALLADLYGPQRLLAEGIVPPELPFGHPNFLWPCLGLVPRQRTWLHVYAADLARAPDGRWWVLADRTQAPSGAGYALENREIVEQVLPEWVGETGVRRVRGFWGELREHLLGFADEGEYPLAVILTPGPYNETYFEHAYIARQMGLPLVEGHDLTVRGDTVYLKTLAGLRRVHAILRRLDDDYCDPVELRGDSALGVPGLIGALRAERVVLANAPGTGVLESAAWLGFHSGAAQRLLGEPLAMPVLATWWCGERPALDYVLANLDQLVLKPTYPNQRFEPVFGRDLEGAAREAFVQRLLARPYAWVAQERVALSQAPALRPSGTPGLTARAVAIRVYVIATANGYRVLPGGLARVATDSAVDVVSTQRGGGSKDIWVLTAGGADEQPPPAVRAPRTQHRHDDIPSRLVENLFWLGRYKVRCADKARLLRSTFAVRTDRNAWSHALEICRELGVVADAADPAASLRDEDNPLGVVADVKRLAWCAAQARSHLSRRYWRGVIGLQRQLREAAVSRSDPREVLERVLMSLAALTGFAGEDMTQDAGWNLMRIGQRLERLLFVAELLAQQLRLKLAPQPAHVEWLLDACDSLRIYRARYATAPRLGPALELLVYNPLHPAALAFQQQQIRQDLAELSSVLGGGGEIAIGESIPFRAGPEIQQLEGIGEDAAEARRRLALKLAAIGAAAGRLSDSLSMRYFSHTAADSQSFLT